MAEFSRLIEEPRLSTLKRAGRRGGLVIWDLTSAETVDSSHKGSNKKGRTKGINDRDRVAAISRGITAYGFMWILVRLLLILVPVTLINSISVRKDLSAAADLRNTVVLYTDILGLWQSLEISRVALSYNMLFGDRYHILYESPLKVYREYFSLMRTVYYPKLIAPKDLGSGIEKIKEDPADFDYCGRYKRVSSLHLKKCGQYAYEFLSYPLRDLLLSLFSMMDGLAEQSILSDGEPASMRAILLEPRNRAFFSLTHAGRFSDDLFHLISQPVVEELRSLLSEEIYSTLACVVDCTFVDLVGVDPWADFAFVISLIVGLLSAWAAYFHVFLLWRRIFRVQGVAPLLLSKGLIIENPLVNHRLKSKC